MQKWINLLTALRRLPPLSELTGDEERLLFELKVRFLDQGSFSVSEVYNLAQGKSAATAYRQLVALKDKGLIEIDQEEDDKRKRKVTFTKTARDLFLALS